MKAAFQAAGRRETRAGEGVARDGRTNGWINGGMDGCIHAWCTEGGRQTGKDSWMNCCIIMNRYQQLSFSVIATISVFWQHEINSQ